MAFSPPPPALPSSPWALGTETHGSLHSIIPCLLDERDTAQIRGYLQLTQLQDHFLFIKDVFQVTYMTSIVWENMQS